MVGSLPTTYYQICSENIILAKGDTIAECVLAVSYKTKSKIKVVTEGTSKYVVMTNPIMINKEVRLPNTWCSSFRDDQVIKDASYKYCCYNGYYIQRVLA